MNSITSTKRRLRLLKNYLPVMLILLMMNILPSAPSVVTQPAIPHSRILAHTPYLFPHIPTSQFPAPCQKYQHPGAWQTLLVAQAGRLSKQRALP